MTQTTDKFYVGIDISKAKFDIYCLVKKEHKIFDNKKSGFNSFVKYLGKLNGSIVLVCEATGGYELDLAQYLYESGYGLIIENPRKIHNFAKALGILAKTDKKDAYLIAKYAERIEPVYREKDYDSVELGRYFKRREELKLIIGQEKNRKEHGSKEIKRMIDKHVKMMEKQVEELDEKITQLISSDPEKKRRFELLKSCKGVGEIVSQSLVICCPEMGYASNRSIAALIGVAPFNNDSGQQQGKRMIWGGRAVVRKKLYMAALVGVRSNPSLKSFYEKLLSKGKKKKVALVACMNKLCGILNTMLQDNKPWVDYSLEVKETSVSEVLG